MPLSDELPPPSPPALRDGCPDGGLLFVSVFGADCLERRVGGQVMVCPFLQQGTFDHLRHHVGGDAFGDAELDRKLIICRGC